MRFFTVYGDYGRPDMAYFSFTKAILEGQEIKVFNQGKLRRDFTHIDDVVAGIQAVTDMPPSNLEVPHRLYNLGNHRSEELLRFIEVLEAACGREAKKIFTDMQPGDVLETYADITESQRDFGFDPKITIDEGLPRFVAWYREFYGL